MPRKALLAGTLLLLAALPAPAAAATSATVSNSTPIAIPAAGNATPFPSAVSVSGLDGGVAEVSATLTGISHESADDMKVLLVAPSGDSVLLMGSRCSGLAGVTFTFSDFAAQRLGTSGESCPSGTYRPGGGPAQTAPTGDSARGGQLSLFTGQRPNGAWKLYVSDTRGPVSGTIAGGWSLTVSSRVASARKCKRKKHRRHGRCVRKKHRMKGSRR